MTVSVADARALWRPEGWLRRVADLLRAHPEVLTAALCALVLLANIRGPDLPAQNYRVWLFRTHGLVVFDSHWYGGHSVPGYSLLFPPLAALVGSRLVGALACVGATAALARLLRGSRRTGYDVALLWFAVVSVIDLVVGRLPFALGLAFGIGALAALREGRRRWALVCAVATGCASPLAAAFLLLAAAAWWPELRRRVWPLAGALAGPASAALFGEEGRFPFPWETLATVLAFAAVTFALSDRSHRTLRRGLVLYAAASLLFFLVPNPVGGNMIRLGATVGGPIVAVELIRAGRRVLLAVVAVPLLAWQLAPLPGALATGHGNAAGSADYYAGLLGYLGAHHANTGRVEVPLTAGRWETDYLATRVALARGWERQVDVARNPVFYTRELTAAAYQQWLHENGVRWVALPDVPLDSSETAEQQLLTGPTPAYLVPVWHDAHWRLWEVRGARSLVRGDARLIAIGVSDVRLDVARPGRSVVLVRWTRFWRVTTGEACVLPTRDGWTAVRAVRPGRVTLTAQVGLGSLAGGGSDGSCSPGLELPAPSGH